MESNTVTVAARDLKPGDKYQGHRILVVDTETTPGVVFVKYHPLDEMHGETFNHSEPVTVEREEFHDLVGAIMAVEEGTASPLETLETLGYLIRSGIINTLQGSWGRAAAEAIRSGFLDYSGNLTQHAVDALGDLDEEGGEW